MTTDPVRWLWTLAVFVLWASLIAVTDATVRRARRREAERSEALLGATGEDATVVAFASQTGVGEELAWMTARDLAKAGWPVRVVSFADLDLAMLKAAQRALFVVSTTGEGDAPDSATRLLRKVLTADVALPHLAYGVLALGDRSYRDFCAFGRAVEGGLRHAGATPLFDRVEVDDADPAAIRHWQHHLNQLTGAAAAPDWTPPAYGRWRLVERIHLNPGSPGGAAVHLALEPIDPLPDWSAGDIAEVGVPASDGEAAPGHRE